MARETYSVRVEHIVEITVETDAFTPDFLTEYGDLISPTSMKEHVQQLAWLHVVKGVQPNAFWEGYGSLEKFGIEFGTADCETSIECEL